jgi:DNA end-binding protein Ku
LPPNSFGNKLYVPRSIWSGSISFGLVNVPVKMYSALDEQDLHFHLLHVKDDSRIGYEKVCKKEDKPVPDDEIVKAYEFGKGEYVYVTDDDLRAAEGKAHKTIEIEDFVPYEEIDPIYFEKTYYLGPAEGAEKVYALMAKAMDESGLAAIGKYVMRDKQHLGCLRIRERAIVLEKMFFADEIRPVDEIKPKNASVGKHELEMASELIDRFAGSFKPEKYEDTYRKDLLKVIRAKRKGKEIHIEPRRQEDEEPVDILAALRASLETARGSRRSKRRTSSRRSDGDGDLGAMTKAELENRAKKAGLSGYSKLSKDELMEALRAA